MDELTATSAFSALAQETRLKAFRMLVEAGPTGLPAGTMSEQLTIPHNTLSFHLSHLSNADLVSSRKDGRSIIYAANFDFMNKLIAFMMENCCRRDASCSTASCTPKKLVKKKRRKP
jgi:ArsR family transcriptional regulator, arsenate/arsenite/antimonite-responsive transcriptional repressor